MKALSVRHQWTGSGYTSAFLPALFPDGEQMDLRAFASTVMLETAALNNDKRTGRPLVSLNDRLSIWTFGGRDVQGRHHAELWRGILETGDRESVYRFIRIEYAKGPAARSQAMLMADLRRQRLVLLGGVGDSGLFEDLWSFDLRTQQWERHRVKVPSTMGLAGATWYVSRKHAYIFGGRGREGTSGELWQLNLEKLSFERLSKAPNGPGPRSGVGMAMHPEDNVLLVYGGACDEGWCNDLHAFDLDSNEWSVLAGNCDAGENCPPPSRYNSLTATGAPWSVMLTVGSPVDGSRGRERAWHYIFSQKKWMTESDARNGGPESQFIQTPTTDDKPESESNADEHSSASLPGSINRLALRHLIKEADLVFIGIVESIDYRSSSVRDKDDVILPHTFVTFKTEEILKGKTAADTITLRFQGGRMEAAKGEFEYLTSTVIPLFDLGDRDILCVKGNGKSICPLVGAKKGRFRVIDDHMYTDLGHPVGLSEKLVWSLPFLRNDIIQPLDLFERLLSPQLKFDKKISSQLSNVVHEGMKAAVKAGPNSAAELYAKYLLARDLNEISGINTLTLSLCSSEGVRSVPEFIPKRLLLEQEMLGVRLRDQTKRLLRKDRKVLSPGEGAFLNRLLLEDLYYPHFIRSLKRSLVSLPFNSREIPSPARKGFLESHYG